MSQVKITSRGIQAPRLPAPVCDATMVTSGCPFCDDDGCVDCRSQPPMRVSAVGTLPPSFGEEDTAKVEGELS